MPKLLSRSGHEEFKSNSTLQIKDQKERRAENTKKMEHSKHFVGLRNFRNLQNFAGCEISQPAKFRRLRNFTTCEISNNSEICSLATVHPVVTVHHFSTVHFPTPCCFLTFLLQFFVSSSFIPCNSFWFWFVL